MKPILNNIIRGMLVVLAVLCAVVAGAILFNFELFYDMFLRPVSFVEVANERTKLINGLESYQSIDEARSWFAVQSITWQVIEDQHLSPDDKRPPYNYYSVSVKNYSHLGCSGKLTVKFLNNRLMSAWFYPTDYDKYFDRLTRQGVHFVTHSRIQELREARIPPYTRVWLYQNYEGNKYVGWEDIRLEKESRVWVMRYS